LGVKIVSSVWSDDGYSNVVRHKPVLK